MLQIQIKGKSESIAPGAERNAALAFTFDLLKSS